MPIEQREALAQIKRARDDSRFKFAAAFRDLEDLTVKQLVAFVEDKSITVVQLIVGRAILKVLKSATVGEVSTIRELMCGPEPKVLELTGADGEDLMRPFAEHRTEELLAAYQIVQSIVKGAACNSTSKSSQPSSVPSPASSRRRSGTAS